MNRRTLLSSVVAGVGSVTGCLGRGESSQGSSGEGGAPEGEPSGSCGAAAEPLSSQLVPEGGAEACFDGAEPSLAIENEREEPLEAAVEITVEGAEAPVLAERYDLESGERVVEYSALPADGDRVATVTIGDETKRETWEEISCYRHGIAIGSDAVEFGLVPPLSGPGDTQHDCYAGDSASIRIDNGARAQSVGLRVVDRCVETTVEETFEMQSNDVERVRDVIVNGGTYDVTIEVENGGSETYAFENDCWGLSASVDTDGEVTVRQMMID
ncbi:hypothetical protein [Halalkalicoccus ordinarius]|uniref:hypothetical protein n=1 Tax=Halalkalicoccus ordinarius TaxID=3116651 RepID=UPI00300EC25D